MTPSSKMIDAAGMRVVALSHVDDGIAFIYGHGTYEGLFTWGDHNPREAHKPTEAEKNDPFKSPRIRLDNGEYMWGFQCWWVEEKVYLKYPPRDEVVVVYDDDSPLFAKE